MKSFKQYINELREPVYPNSAIKPSPPDFGRTVFDGFEDGDGKRPEIVGDKPKPPPGWPGPRPESVKVWKAGYGEDAAFWADLDGNGDPDTEIFWDEEGGYWYYIDEVGNPVQVP